MSTASHTEVRQQLARSGYSPLPLEGKVPNMMKGWQNKMTVSVDEIELWAKLYPAAKNTGVLTKFTPRIVDTSDVGTGQGSVISPLLAHSIWESVSAGTV
jgi:hypothetical protein